MSDEGEERPCLDELHDDAIFIAENCNDFLYWSTAYQFDRYEFTIGGYKLAIKHSLN